MLMHNEAKYEELSSLTVVYGRKPVLEILRHEATRLQKLYVQQGARFPSELANKLSLLQEKSRSLVSETDEQDLTCRAGNDRHQGIVALVKPGRQYSFNELITRSKQRNQILVIGDQITDPQNLGSIMRCAEAAGADGLLLTSDRSAKVGESVIRSSAGASEFLPVVKVKNLQRALRDLKASGFWIVGLDAEPSAQGLYERELPQPLAIVLGSEGQGLRPLTKRECDLLVVIPMRGMIESLNVGQAAAVCLFEVMRRAITKG